MTHPNVMTASYLSDSIHFCADAGNSKAPGTLIISSLFLNHVPQAQ